MIKDEIIKWLEEMMNKGGLEGARAYHAKELIEDQDSVDYALKVLSENGWRVERIIREG